MIDDESKPRLGPVAAWLLTLVVAGWGLAANGRRRARRYERQLNAVWRAEHDSWPFR